MTQEAAAGQCRISVRYWRALEAGGPAVGLDVVAKVIDGLDWSWHEVADQLDPDRRTQTGPHRQLERAWAGASARERELLEGVLRVAPEVGPAGSGDMLVLAQAAPGTSRTRLVRVALRSPGLGMDLQGRPVYWLGRAGAQESFDWARAVFEDDGNPSDIREGGLEILAYHDLPAAREYASELLDRTSVARAGIFDPDAVARLWTKCLTEIGRGPLSNMDSMALTGVLSTQLLHEAFVSNFSRAPVSADTSSLTEPTEVVA